MAQDLQHIDLDNQEFQNAWNLIRNTRRSVFLTGKAGTGKSTFLRYICAHTRKTYVVLAPTGIAAVNVAGSTLHSFFKIPFKPLLPDDPDYSPRRIRKTLRYGREKVKLLRKLDLIIIDEISMVRCDIIDFIDKVLRVYCENMREPFGGKQLLFVGDVFQLEPVVTPDFRSILRRYYDQFFFFNARVFTQLGLIPIELRKIYRQENTEFVAMLDRVREDHATDSDLQSINTRVNPNVPENDNDTFSITLATRRDTVNDINDTHMRALNSPEFTFKGEVEGNFPDNELPTSKELVLKQGAQVLFIRNDKEGRWVNGTIGKVSKVSESALEVALEDGDCYTIEPEVWENVQYTYDEKEKKVVESLLGTFKQYPVKPAWAITIHKSQGLTFNKVVIDFAGGAFTSGQTYVALSRCTSLEGITLLKPLSQRDIILNRAIVDFSRRFNDEHTIREAMELERANALYSRAVFALDHDDFATAVDCFVEAMKVRNVMGLPSFKRFVTSKLHRFARQADEIKALTSQIDEKDRLLHDLAMEYTAMGDQALGLGELADGDGRPSRRGKKKLDKIAVKSAMANYQKAIKIEPHCVEAMVGRARLLAAIHEVDEALAQIKQALKVSRDNELALMALGEVREQEEDWGGAVKAYKRAVRANRKSPLPHEALARLFTDMGLDDLAEDHAKIARKLRERSRRPKK